MKTLPHYLLLKALILISLVMSGCTVVKTVWKPYDEIELIATQDVNPDGNDRASPIQLRIYQLTSRTTVDNLEFDELYFNGEALLSDELLSLDEVILQPGESLSRKIALQDTAGFIAVVAAFRNLDTSKWKFVYDVHDYGHYRHPVTIEANSIRAGRPHVDEPVTEQEVSSGAR